MLVADAGVFTAIVLVVVIIIVKVIDVEASRFGLGTKFIIQSLHARPADRINSAAHAFFVVAHWPQVRSFLAAPVATPGAGFCRIALGAKTVRALLAAIVHLGTERVCLALQTNNCRPIRVVIAHGAIGRAMR